MLLPLTSACGVMLKSIKGVLLRLPTSLPGTPLQLRLVEISPMPADQSRPLSFGRDDSDRKMEPVGPALAVPVGLVKGSAAPLPTGLIGEVHSHLVNGFQPSFILR
jgi:hypothetical protein